MQQYYLNKELEETILIEDEKFHYLKNVIRVKKGENILLFNAFLKAQYEIVEINKKNILVRKIKDINLEFTVTNVTLAVGLLKKDNIELVIQKAVELEVNQIILTKFINNVVKFDNKEDKKIKRYNQISISACEQSKRNSLCEVKYEDSIKNIDFKQYDKVYLLYEQEESINSLFKEVNRCNKDDKILLIVGPEGGFDNKEIEYFKENKLKFTSLGKNILRAETAAIIAVGLTTNILNEKE